MKKITLIIIATAAITLAGCNQGGSGDQYNTSTGTSSITNTYSSPNPNSPKSTAISPGGVNTNSSGFGPR